MVAEQMVETPGLVHPILTNDQAELTHQALIAFLNIPEGSLSENPAEEKLIRDQLSELVFFFSNVVDHPEAFGVRSALETKRLIRTAKPVKGPAQLNKRKRRQKSRPSYEKRTRREKRAEAEAYNAAQKIMQEEAAEAEQANHDEQVRRIERFNELTLKDAMSTEELQELLDLLGYENVSESIRLRRAEDTPEARIAAAAAKAEREHDGEE